MGTAAKGSLMLTVTWISREIFNVFFHWAAYAKESGGPMQALCCCANQCVHAFGCLKFINKMAFLQTVLHGFTFCDGSLEGNKDVYMGQKQWAHTTFMASFVLVSAKVSISLLATAMCALMIHSGNCGIAEDDLTYYWIPYFLTFTAAYVLATASLLIFEVAIDAMMVAFCEARYSKLVKQDKTDPKNRGGILEYQLPKALKDHMDKYAPEQEETTPLNQTVTQ